MSFRLALLLGLVATAPTACVAGDTRDAGRAYYSGRPQDAERELLARLEEDPDGRALYLNELGVIALDHRDLDVAYRRFLDASLIMNAFTTLGAKEVGAIVGTESSKIWRGDPYELAMNSYYLGIVNLLRGIDDNGLAGFKNAVFADSSRVEKYDCDFAPAWFLEGFAYQRLRDETMAGRDYVKARELRPSCHAFEEANRGNLVVVVDVGQGPTKVNAGAHGEATRFLDHSSPAGAVEIVVDGQKLGTADEAGDVFFQATTRGGREFDRVLRGKAIYKSGAQVAGITTLLFADELKDKYQAGAQIAGWALILSSLLVDARADTRHWTTLPARVQLFRGALAPGAHEIEIVPSSGWRVAGPQKQTVTVPADGDVLVYQRVLP